MNKDEAIEIATFIKSKLTPFAFTCSCKGEHEDCHRVITEDVYAIATVRTLESVERMLIKYAEAKEI
jgi:hypothetical protein